MLKNLLYKELKIALNPNIFLFSLFGVMVIIPNYPVLVGFIYVVMVLVIIYSIGNENKDNYFTALLPVKKRDVVTAKFLSISLLHLASLLFTIPFCFVYKAIHASGEIKPLGLEANVAMFGFVLIIYGVENISFFPMYYKTTRKLLMPVLMSLISSLLILGLVQGATIASPTVNNFINDNMWFQLVVLAFGLVVYFVLTLVSYKVSTKRFEKIDL